MTDVQTSIDAGVLTITLNRPEVLNALTATMHDGIREALRHAGSSEVGSVVLTGAGRGFCVGQDLAEISTLGWDEEEHLRRFYNPNILALRRVAKPVIAAVNGVTAGAGIGLACACDLRVCAVSASFVLAFDAVALVPDGGTSFFVPRLIGRQRAFRWFTQGGALSAEEAKAAGLVDEVVPDGELHRHAAELAADYVRRPSTAIGLAKSLLNREDDAALAAQLEQEAQLQRVAGASPDHEEAVARFLKRRSS